MQVLKTLISKKVLQTYKVMSWRNSDASVNATLMRSSRLASSSTESCIAIRMPRYPLSLIVTSARHEDPSISRSNTKNHLSLLFSKCILCCVYLNAVSTIQPCSSSSLRGINPPSVLFGSCTLPHVYGYRLIQPCSAARNGP